MWRLTRHQQAAVDPFLLILRPCLRRKREIWTEAGYFLKTFIAFPSQQEVARRRRHRRILERT
jgi:hypothetical protein